MIARTMGESGAETRRLTGLPLLIVALGVVIGVQSLFVLSYVGALQSPKPHRVAFGVVGLLMVFAVYLMLVRGPALLLDLGRMSVNMLCL